MALVTHTPGPWTFDPIGDDLKGDPEFPHCDDAAFWIAEDCHAGEVLAVAIRMPKDEPATEANARLIAAAPELLDALKTIRGAFYKCMTTNGTDPEFATIACQSYDAAIAKAEGK